jgi:hypothetical protein
MARRSWVQLLGGVAIGALLVSPVGAHVGDSISHLWGGDGHIKDKVVNLGDSRYQRFGANHNPLPPGQTMTGTISERVQVNDQYVLTAVSFGGKLRFTPTVEILADDAPSTENCPGTAANPSARPGYFCVYTAWQSGMDNDGWSGFWDPITGNTTCACKRGVTLYTTGSASAEVSGSWAIKAPTDGAGATSTTSDTGASNGRTGSDRS